MTMPKKGSREITVDGKKYRWMARSSRTGVMRVSVEDPETKKCFQKELPTYKRLGYELWLLGEAETNPITPKDVEAFIRKVFSKAACEREREP